MKTIIKLFLSSMLLIGLSNCSSTKQEAYQIQKEVPFKIYNATYQEWVAGVRGGGSGINIVITIDEESASKIEFDSLFFRGQKVKLVQSVSKLTAHIKTKLNSLKDITLHQNTQEEYGNQPPIIENSIPFILSNKEAVICFKEESEVKYVKILLAQIKSPLYQ